MRHLGQAVHDHIDGVMALGSGQAHDVVRLGPLPGAQGYREGLHGVRGFLGSVFVLCTGVAPFYVCLDIGCHIWPPVSPFYELICPRLS